MQAGDQPARHGPSGAAWTSFADMHPLLAPPLRPSAADVRRFRSAIAGRSGHVLMLGVTPELACLGTRLTAVDLSPRMIAEVWPGDDARARAVPGDWTALPMADATFDAVIGDGSLSSGGDDLAALLGEAARVLVPGGTAVFRAFCALPLAEPLAAIRADPAPGGTANFHALKFRIAMALAAGAPRWSVPVRTIRAAFDAMFPDRAALARDAGLDPREIATIDGYEHAGHSLLFTPLDELVASARACFREIEVIVSTGYPLAERCPLIAMRGPQLRRR